MQPLINHARKFHRQISSHHQRREEFARLTAGQRPHVLFITCSDSRVVPTLIMNTRPGQLFELRTAGNIIPPHRPGHPSGEAATIEYAVDALGVTDVVICGHSHCGAMGALISGDDLDTLPAVRAWLTYAAPPQITAGTDNSDALTRAVQRNVVSQVARLSTYPCIQRRQCTSLADPIRLHGWFYQIDTGLVLTHQPELMRFVPL
jgi:carbonic anhydrase